MNELFILTQNNPSTELLFSKQYGQKMVLNIVASSLVNGIEEETDYDGASVRFECKFDINDAWQDMKFNGTNLIATTSPFTVENPNISMRDQYFKIRLQNPSIDTKILLRVRFE